MSQTHGRLDDPFVETDADPLSAETSDTDGTREDVGSTLVYDTIPPPPNETGVRWTTWAARIWKGLANPGPDLPAAPLEADDPGIDDDDVPPEVPGFVLRGECGRGGMGVVYLAEQEALGRTVVLKFLRPELAGSSAQRARLKAEAVALARLQHPNIVQVFGSGEHLGRAYIVQEYLPGGSLESRLGHEPQPPKPAAELLRTLATAVSHAHDQKIVHRDLKPSNVLLAADGTPKISDFGLAKQIELAGTPGGTQSGAIIGSPSYMAPEQAMGRGRDVGPSADIYALGAILYEALTGRPPFVGTSMADTLLQVRGSDPIAPRQLRSGLPRDLETICLKCLAKDPGRRYASAAELAEDLTRFLESRPISAKPASMVERLQKSVRRRPAVAASLAAATLAAVTLVVGSLAYEARLRAALSDARNAADEARDRKRAADERYRLAREAINLMLRRLNDRSLSQTPRIKELRRRQLEDALVFFRGVLATSDNLDPAARMDVADAYIQSGIAEGQLGRPGPAHDNLSRAIELLERLLEVDPVVLEANYNLATAKKMLAEYIAPPQTKEDSVRLLGEAQTLLEDLSRRDPADVRYRVELAGVRNNLGNAEFSSGRLDRAEKFYEQSVETCRELLKGPGTSSPNDTRVLMAKTLQNLAVAVQQSSRQGAAEAHYAESRDLLLETLKTDPNHDEAILQLGYTDLNFAIFLTFQPGGRDRSDAILIEAIGRISPLLEREPELTVGRNLLYRCHGALAQSFENRRLFADAVKHRARAITLIDNPSEREHLSFIQALTVARAGDYREAWRELTSLEPSLEGRPPDYTTHLAKVLAACLEAMGRDKTLQADERAMLSRQFGKKGHALLTRSLERTPAADRVAQSQEWLKDSELAALRQVDSVRALLNESSSSSKSRGVH